jgi:L-threonylcarbamoyladenylate synthase
VTSLYKVPSADLLRACELLHAGRLVAFPTETVYGLGANALDADAVARIFEAKGRPRTSPLIVHVSSEEMLQRVASSWPETAHVLAEKFWPGPLTLVLPKQPQVPDVVTAGLATVGVRIPSHSIAQALIKECDLPLAAPSANRFTQLSPTTAEHVRQSLGDRVDFILDGGPCEVGIESTVLSLATERPTLLRPGGVSREEIEKLVGPVDVITKVEEGPHASPGLHAKHYSPRTRLVLSKNGEVPQAGRGAYLQLHHSPDGNAQIVLMPQAAEAYAAALYGMLHDLDERHFDWIAVEHPPSTREWEAVLDRLRRAAQ